MYHLIYSMFNGNSIKIKNYTFIIYQNCIIHFDKIIYTFYSIYYL